MRTASDVLTDPRPGDVVDIMPGWRRWVRQAFDRGVIFDAVNEDGDFKDCCVTVDQWQTACRTPTCEVVHVAE
jgi:hypothetical protein